MRFSTVPFLVIAIVVLVAMATRRVANQGQLSRREVRSVHLLLAVLVGWGVLSSTLALTGVYASPRFLSLLPGLWLPFVPFVLAIGGTVISPDLRSALRSAVNHTPRHWQIYVHAARILAIGTILKARAGEFPAYFAYLVGVPDLIFGLSAFIVGRQALADRLHRRSLIAWNLVGVAVILPASPLMQMGLPGPLEVFTSEPTASRMLEFPMVLAPTLVVPMFVLLNMVAAWVLISRGTER